MNEELIEKEYGYLGEQIYMDCSSIGIPPTRLKEKLSTYFDAYMNDGGKHLDEFFHSTYNGGKQEIANLFGVQPKNIGFFKSTSDAIISIANSLDLKSGDNVVLTNEEHPANVIPWLGLERNGVEIKFASSTLRVITAADVISQIDENTKVVSISSILYCTGSSVDLKKIADICKEKDIFFIVDAIQSSGRIALKPQEIGIDFLATGGYKSLLGIKGIAVGYLSDSAMEKIVPYTGSNQSVKGCGRPTVYKHYADVKFCQDASVFENGNHNYMGILSLKTSCGMINEIGIENIEKHVVKLDKMMREGLKSLPVKLVEGFEGGYSGVVVAFPDSTINYEKFQAEIKASNLKIAVRDDGMRIGLSFYNTEKQVEAAIEIIKDCLAAASGVR